MTHWNPAKDVYQCGRCGYRWRSLTLLWSWSYHCPWCGKLQSVKTLVEGGLKAKGACNSSEVENERGDVEQPEDIDTCPGKRMVEDGKDV